MADWPSVNFDWLANLPRNFEETRIQDLTKASLANLKSNDAASLRKKGTELISLGNVAMGMQLYQAALAREQLAEKGADRAMWAKIYPQLRADTLKGPPGTTVPGQEPAPEFNPYGGPPVPGKPDLFQGPQGAMPSGAPPVPGPQSAVPPGGQQTANLDVRTPPPLPIVPSPPLQPSPNPPVPLSPPRPAQGPSDEIISQAQAGGPPPPPPAGPQLAGPPPPPEAPPQGLPAQLPPFMQGATAPAVGAGGAPPAPPGAPPPLTGSMKPEDSSTLEAQARYWGAQLQQTAAAGKYGTPAAAYAKARLHEVLDRMKLNPDERAYLKDNAQALEQGKSILSRSEWEDRRRNAPETFKELVDATKPYTEGARTAIEVRDKLGMMRSIVHSDAFVSGDPASSGVRRIGQLISGLRSTVTAMGGDPAVLNNIPVIDKFTKPAAMVEIFNALSNQAVIATLNGLGNQVSNADRDYVGSSFPHISNTKEGNRIMIELLDALQERKQVIGRMAAAYREKHKNKATGSAAEMQLEIQNYVDNNNLMVGKDRSPTKLALDIAKDTGRPPPGAAQAPQAAPTGRGPIGGPDRTINGPNGPVRVINGNIVPMDQQGL